ncbi:hypothetical protein ES703_118560 [subsurface metagenome]
MYQQILEMLLAKYGHLSYSKLKEALRKDGLGEFVDAIENDADLMGLLAEISQEYGQDGLDDSEYGIIPSTAQQMRGIPVEYYGTFNFDPQACLKTCKGNCCKNKNYLMINITDIFKILSSEGAQFFDIRSTIDLFDRKPPFIELFYVEEYRLFLPYIRYLPVNADVHTRPEDSQGSICPFLHPIHEVYAYHKKALPQWAGKDALGCILMADKPTICRLSPLGKSSGMVTGKVTYEYLKPALDCPACETDVELKVSDYVSSVVSSSEQQQQERFHEMLMSYYRAETSQELDQERFNEIIKHVYNIDGLLYQYGLGSEHRPHVGQLVEIVFAASHGDFSVYEQFIDELSEKDE